MLKETIIKKNLVASQARTANGDSGALDMTEFEDLDAVIFELPVSAAGGTTPTLDLYVQESFDGGTTFVDVAHFSQVTAALTNPHRLKVAYSVLADAFVNGIGDAIVAANSLGLPLLSKTWRIKWVIAGGGGQTFTFEVNAYLLRKVQGQ